MSNVPKLRFKEFDGEWHKSKLKKYLSFNNGINAPKEAYGYGRKFINVLDILNNDFILYKNIIGSVFVSPKIEEANKVEYGDVLFLRSSETREDVGKSTVYLEEKEYALFGGFVIRGKNKGNYNPYFLKLNLESPKTRYQIGSKAGGSTRFNVSQSVLNSIEVKMPCLAEQQKIANYFLLMEKKIKDQQRKIELLREQKKGYMQKIFNRELRLNDEKGMKFPEWELVKIGDVFRERTEKGNESYELLSVTLEQGVIRRSQINTKDNSNPNKSKYKVVNKEDIVYNSMRMWQGANGVSNYEGIVSPAYTVLIPSEKVYPLFIGYLFKHDRMIYEFKRYSQGLTSDTWNLKYPQISEIKIKLPCKSEQKRIGEFFHLIDKKIKFETTKLNEMIQKKKFFMQNMFL